MKIGVISDTHIPQSGEWLPEKLCEELKKVDLILHAGDLTEMQVLEKLNKLAPTKAVRGNMDTNKVRKVLPEKEIIEAGKFKIGLIHGFGAPFGLIGRLKDKFNGVDVIIFGHSHSPENRVENGILFFNPGSPTDKVFTKFNSYGILNINDRIKGEIIKL